MAIGDVGNDATEEEEFVSDWHPDFENPKLHPMAASTAAPCVLPFRHIPLELSIGNGYTPVFVGLGCLYSRRYCI